MSPLSEASASRSVFLKKGTRTLFGERRSLREIGRRVLGKVEADFRQGRKPKCPQLLRDDWQALVVALDRPQLAEFAAELALRIEGFIRDDDEAWITIDAQSGSNSVEFAEGENKVFTLDRPLAHDRFGWFGASEDALVPKIVAGTEEGADGLLRQSWREFQDALDELMQGSRDASTQLTNFYTAHRRLGLLLRGRLESSEPEVVLQARGYAQKFLAAAPPLVLKEIPGTPREVVEGWRSYQRTQRFLREKLEQLAQLTKTQ